MSEPSEEIIHLNFGVKALEIVGEDLEHIKRLNDYAAEGAIRILENNNVLPYTFCQLQKKLLDFEYRNSDIFITGYPKSGTTWVNEIVWTICHNPDLNNPLQDKFLPFDRVPVFSAAATFAHDSGQSKRFRSRLYPYVQCDPEMELMDMIKLIPDPRVYKSHLTSNLVDPKLLEHSKVVYVVRNPMDSFISYYYFSKNYLFTHFKGSIAEFVDDYLKGVVIHGTGTGHIQSWLRYRYHKNVHFIFYEDLLKSTFSEIKKLSTFLGKDLTDQQLNNVLEQTKFDKMSISTKMLENDYKIKELGDMEQIKKTGGFFRTGKSGTSKESLPKELYDKLAEYFKKELKGLDLPYEF